MGAAGDAGYTKLSSLHERYTMITANFIHRTFRIKCGDSVGTGFTIDVNGKQYLVTARHVVKGFSSSTPLEVYENNAWVVVEAALVEYGDGDVDVSVIAPKAVMSPENLPAVPSSKGLAYGQDVYFLGFPYGVLSNIIFAGAGHPLPLVKKALFSAFAGDVYLLDGHNNPGFSGGPVIFGPSGALPQNIAAIVSGYRFHPEAIHLGDAETELTYRHNTGIMITYKIEIALAMIQANPIGVSV